MFDAISTERVNVAGALLNRNHKIQVKLVLQVTNKWVVAGQLHLVLSCFNPLFAVGIFGIRLPVGQFGELDTSSHNPSFC